MEVLLAYSTKTKNTKRVAEAIYDEIKNFANVTLLDIKKQKRKLEKDYDLYILGAWTDKTTVNKDMQEFIDNQSIKNKNVVPFLTCGVPKEDKSMKKAIDNYVVFMEERGNNVVKTFICQGKIDPKMLVVFRVLTWKDPNFIHKVTPELKEMVKNSKKHPNEEDFLAARECFRELFEGMK